MTLPKRWPWVVLRLRFTADGFFASYETDLGQSQGIPRPASPDLLVWQNRFLDWGAPPLPPISSSTLASGVLAFVRLPPDWVPVLHEAEGRLPPWRQQGSVI